MIFKVACQHLQKDGNLASGRCQSGAIEYGVKWGDWVGASQNPRGQENIEVAWNLSRIESITGQATTLSYVNQIQDVGRELNPDGMNDAISSYRLYRTGEVALTFKNNDDDNDVSNWTQTELASINVRGYIENR